MSEWILHDIGKITMPTPFPVGSVNVFLIKGEALTLIDAGVKTKTAWEAFQAGLKDLGFTPRDIEQVVLTHDHPDHVGLLDFMPDVQVLGHIKCQRWMYRTDSFMQEYRSFYKAIFHEFGVPDSLAFNIKRMEASLNFSCKRNLTMELKEGMELRGLPGWQVVETPGHAQSHLSFINESRGLMFGGDHILATISSNPLIEPPEHPSVERPKPQLQYNESLRKLKSFHIETVFSGHGKEVTHIPKLIDRRLNRQHDRAMKVIEIMGDKQMTGFEICQALFPQVYEKELNLTMSETIGQLDYLMEIGRIREEIKNGIKVFFVV